MSAEGWLVEVGRDWRASHVWPTLEYEKREAPGCGMSDRRHVQIVCPNRDQSENRESQVICYDYSCRPTAYVQNQARRSIPEPSAP